MLATPTGPTPMVVVDGPLDSVEAPAQGVVVVLAAPARLIFKPACY